MRAPAPHFPRLLTPLPAQIYQLPDWRLVFLVKNFPVGQRVLVDSSFGQPTTQGEARKEEATRQGELPLVKEVLLVALGSRQSRPYLLVSARLVPRGGPAGSPRSPADPALPPGARGPGAAHLRGLPPRLPAWPGKPQSPFQEGAVGGPSGAWGGRGTGLGGTTRPSWRTTPSRSRTTSTSVRRSQSRPRRKRKAAAPRRGLGPVAVWPGSGTSRTSTATQG